MEILLLDDKLVITNPGGLWGISSDQLGKSEGKSAVNEFLYDICKFTRTREGDRVIEGEGGGIREVEASLRMAGLAAPRYIDKGISFTVVVPRHALLPPDDVTWLAVNDAQHLLTPMESQILTSMRHGQVWTNALVRTEFPSTDSREAHRALLHLVDLGFAQTIGERGSCQYGLDPRWEQQSLTDEPTIVVTAPSRPLIQDTLPDLVASGPEAPRPPREERDRRLSPAGRKSPRRTVAQAVATGPLTARAIAETTGLSINSVRNALRHLIDEGVVRVNGGWGVKGTTYEVESSTPT